MRFREWLGIGERRWKKAPDEEVQPAKTLWDWLELLIVPAILIVVVALWNASQTSRDKRQEDDARQAATLTAYLDQMSHLILERDLLSSEVGSPVRAVARSVTLTTLRRVGVERKGAVIRFLYESHLLQIPQEQDIYLNGADLSGANLAGAQLPRAFLGDVNNLNGLVDLGGANLAGANLRGANLRGAILLGADLNHADLRGANLRGANLGGADLRHADLRNADLTRDKEGDDVQLGEADLRNANLSHAHLSGAFLSSAQLEDANLRGADLAGANLVGATGLNLANLLRHANLVGVTLGGVDLSHANLRDVNLRGVKLGGADLRGADLRGADLRGADLEGANLSDAKNLNLERFITELASKRPSPFLPSPRETFLDSQKEFLDSLSPDELAKFDLTREKLAKLRKEARGD